MNEKKLFGPVRRMLLQVTDHSGRRKKTFLRGGGYRYFIFFFPLREAEKTERERSLEDQGVCSTKCAKAKNGEVLGNSARGVIKHHCLQLSSHRSSDTLRERRKKDSPF